MQSIDAITRALLGDDPPRVESDDYDVWGREGATPHYVALVPEPVEDTAEALVEAAESILEAFGDEAGLLPGFRHYYDGRIEEAEIRRGARGFVISGTVVSVDGDEAMWFDAAITAVPEGPVIAVAFSHQPRRAEDPTLDLDALDLGALRSERYASFTVGAG